MSANENNKTEVKLVKMVRSKKDYPSPWTADVHPNEVKNMKTAGWEVAK